MFWSTERIIERQLSEALVEPFDQTHISQGAYELALGPEVFITSQSTSTKQQLHPGEAVVIPPGQLGVLLTEESVSIPADAIGFISMRTRVKLGGLINVSGFHVDPGFNGRLKFSVYNAGSSPRVLQRGDALFLLWFCDLDRATTDVYGGNRQHQVAISAEDQTLLQGHVASPAQLKSEIDELNALVARLTHRIDLLTGIGITILVMVLGTVVLPAVVRQLSPVDGAPIQVTVVPTPTLTQPTVELPGVSTLTTTPSGP